MPLESTFRRGGGDGKAHTDVQSLSLARYAVLLFVAFEFFGGLAMCIVFLWTNLWHLVPQSWDKFAVAMVAMAVVLPTVWIKRFSELTFISMLGLASSSLIALTVLGIAIYSAVV